MEQKPITVLVIDDLDSDRAFAVRQIAHFVPSKRIHTAANTVEVMRILQTVPIDLVFIDMEMPDNTGFAVAKCVESTQPRAKYAFLTGHAELGAESYEYDPIDFLCKPVSRERLERTFERFARSRSPFSQDRIPLETGEGTYLLSPADVLYIAREKQGASIVCREKRLAVKKSLSELELIFGDFGLVRCHQSYLISIHHVLSLRQASFGRTYLAELEGGQSVPVSRSQYTALKEQLQEL